MAKEPEEKKEEKTEEKSAGGGFGLFTWIILAAVVVAGSTGGFALSQLIGGQDEAIAVAEEDNKADEDNLDEMFAAAEDQTSWVYEGLEPVLANLDEPGVTRYVRVTIMIELSPGFDKLKGEIYLDSKTNDLRDWMTTYFAGLSLEDVRGTRNLSRIKKEVTDQFNELLFSDTKPFVQRVLFKEFAVQ